MEDHFDIKSLPSNFVSKSHPSPIIEKLKEKRKNAHNATIEEMTIKTKELNTEIEEEILRVSNHIKCKLKKMRDDVDSFIHLVHHMREHEFETVEKTYFQGVSKKILNSNENRKATVDELYFSLAEIEKKRCEKLKLILNETYTKMLEISYKLPFELEEFFEKEILKINQMTLNNYQHYVELQAELKLQIENDMRAWMQTLYEVKEKFQKHLKEMAYRQGQHSDHQSQYDFIDTTYARMNRRLSEYDAMKMVLEFKLSQIYIQVDLKNIHIWLQDVQMTMACLDRSAKYIVNIYKAAIVVIFHRFFKELQDIKTSMLDIDMLSKEEIKPHECEIYTPTADELNLQSEQEFQSIKVVKYKNKFDLGMFTRAALKPLQLKLSVEPVKEVSLAMHKKVWGNLITYIEDALNETYAFVKMSTYLWDYHFIRIEEVRDLVLEDVGNTIEKNISAEEDTEIKLNILLDKLRQSPTQQKLEKCLSDVKISLDKLEELYHIHNAEEQKVVEKYREFVDIEVEVLMAEIKRFLILHPPDEERDPKKQRKRASQESQVFVDPTEALIPNQMLFCRYEVDAVSNWMFGLWEALNHYITTGKAEIMAKAEEWINIQHEKTKTRLEIKSSLFKSRYERIVYSVYEKRLEELNRHSDRFKSHQMAVDIQIKKLTQTIKIHDEKYNQVLNKFSLEKERIFQNILNAKRSSQIRRYKKDLKRISDETSYSIDRVLEDTNNSCDKLAEKVKFSCMKFKSAIRLFSEDGNYNIDEARTVIKNLNKTITNATKNFDLIKRSSKTAYTNCMGKMDGMSSDALLSVDEIIQEFEHNEKCVTKIINLQNEIRNLVVSVKASTIKVNKLVKNLLEASTMKLGETDFLQLFSKKIEEVVEQIKKNALLLVHPEPVILYSSAGYKQNISSLTDDQDFASYLFKTKPIEDDECFVSKLNNSLFSSFSIIQEEAKEFYMKHKILLDYPKIQPTYNKFMKEVLGQFRNLLTQSEICWLQTTFDFMNSIDSFLKFKKEYLLEFECKFYTNNQEFYENVQDNIMKTLKNTKEDLESAFKNVHSKLKTLHGHPNNRHLLNQLQQEFSKMMTDTEKNLKIVLPPHKEVLLKEFENIRDTYIIIKNELDCLANDDSLIDIKTTLANQLSTKLNLMKQLIEESDDESKYSENDKNGDIPLSISAQMVNYMRSTQNPPEIKNNISTNSSLSNTTDEEQSARNFLNELQKDFEKYDQDIIDFIDNKINNFHKELHFIWENDVKNILNLYRVKYDIINLSK